MVRVLGQMRPGTRRAHLGHGTHTGDVGMAEGALLTRGRRVCWSHSRGMELAGGTDGFVLTTCTWALGGLEMRNRTGVRRGQVTLWLLREGTVRTWTVLLLGRGALGVGHWMTMGCRGINAVYLGLGLAWTGRCLLMSRRRDRAMGNTHGVRVALGWRGGRTRCLGDGMGAVHHGRGTDAVGWRPGDRSRGLGGKG